MSKARDLDCYRVPIFRTGLYRAPIIAALAPGEAKARAAELAEDLLRKRLPWLMEGGVTRPQRAAELPISIGEPVLLHSKGTHG